MVSRIETARARSRNPGRRLRRGRRVLAIGAALWALAPAPAPAQALDPDSLLARIKYLASDALAGREAGEPGADSAAAYIERAFEAYGLEPLGTDGYRQPFGISTTLAIDSSSRLILESSRGRHELKLYDEWLPFTFSGAGTVTGPVVAVGHGLSADDYAGAPGDVPYIALVRGGTPPDFDPHSSGADATPRRRATSARDAGAAAVLMTVTRIEVPQPGEPPHGIGIPAAQVIERDDVLAWLSDTGLRATIDARVAPARATTYNVIGRIPGRDPELADRVIVVGAHYDHLGLGGPGSLAPDVVEPHNGADDNASGTSLLLGLARYFARHPEDRPARTLVFVAFSAEEMGLLGSEYFVDHPPIPLDRVTAMVNFDMVGRLRHEKLQVFGTGTAKEFPALLDSLAAESPLTLTYIGDGYGPSDQTSFYAKGIPVLHLFTGTHSQYHRPEDDWPLINAGGMVEVGEFAIALIRALGDRRESLTPIRRERPRAGGGGYGPYLGTVPDFGEVEGGGLRLSGVRPGSPADKAGLRAGDVVIEFGGRQVTNIYDYTYALRDHAPGDTVVIRVRRGDAVLALTAVLGRRR